jgi:uncharacterized protein (DUF2141 family)
MRCLDKKEIMKTFIVVVFLLAGLDLRAQSNLEVVVKNINEAKGNIRVGIFKDDNTFLKDALLGKVVKASTGELKVVFENVPGGTYALSVIHDANENGELDSNMIGIPKEGFGFSNDAMGTFGPPKFEKASIKVGPDVKSVIITMRYM